MVAIVIGGKDMFGRGRSWIDDRKIVERGEGAWEWLRRDDRGRIVGLVLASVAVSIAMSLLATALVRIVESRRANGAAPVAEAPVVEPVEVAAVEASSDPVEVAPAEA